MSVSKRDYQAIARAIHTTREQYPSFSRHHVAGERSPAEYVAEALADALAADNPRFDRERFIEACETGRCKGMAR